jgi:hypothetical protein
MDEDRGGPSDGVPGQQRLDNVKIGKERAHLKDAKERALAATVTATRGER